MNSNQNNLDDESSAWDPVDEWYLDAWSKNLLELFPGSDVSIFKKFLNLAFALGEKAGEDGVKLEGHVKAYIGGQRGILREIATSFGMTVSADIKESPSINDIVECVKNETVVSGCIHSPKHLTWKDCCIAEREARSIIEREERWRREFDNFKI